MPARGYFMEKQLRKSKTSRSAHAGIALGVDIGGTFTDFALFDRRSGEFRSGKILTDYEDLTRGVMAGVAKILAEHGIDGALLESVVHGTTLVTNSLIERRGVPAALLVTSGFADVLELARESRYDIYDIDIDLPRPLIARDRVFEVSERLDFKGRVLQGVDADEVEAIAQRLAALKVSSVAICFLHSYANAAHEQEVARILAKRLPALAISLSSEVVSDVREYERASTTAANAYVQPIVRGYLERLNAALRSCGFKSELAIITSDGGIASCSTAGKFPVRLTESGPAGGAIAAAYFGKRKKVDDLIAYDMGGTTAKICVIEDGAPEKSTTFEFGRAYRFARGSGLPLQVPVIEMIEIGAGGGSIARVNELGLLQVGPQSANAAPGPACYGLGGELPTVTDADLCLGYLAEDFFLGGKMRLDKARAQAAISQHIGKPLSMTLQRAAWGIHRIVNDTMARAAKVHCLEQGKDARRYALFAYGGAGPVHAYGVAVALGIQKILYPRQAGVMSALGFLVAEPSFEVVRGKSIAGGELDAVKVGRMLEEMQREGLALVKTVGVAGTDIEVERMVAMRYAGQSFELNVPLPPGALSARHFAAVTKLFAASYKERYHALTEESPVEFVRWHVRVTARQPQLELKPGRGRRRLQDAVKGKRRAYIPERSAFADCPVYDRHALPLNCTFKGPAIIEEIESTVFVGQAASIRVDGDGDIMVTRTMRRAGKA